jgi:hypothetical protein
MKNISKLAIALIAIITMTSCQKTEKNVPLSSQVRNTSKFDKIDISGPITVYYLQTDSFSIKVEAPKNIMNDVETNINNGTLSINYMDKDYQYDQYNEANIYVYVTSPDLVSVIQESSGSFMSKKRVDTDDIDLCVTGSGDITFNDIICDNINSRVQGSGDITVNKLECIESGANVLGSGIISLIQHNVDKTFVSITGSGDVEMRFLDCGSLVSNIIGSGTVTAKGNIKSLKQNKMGSGTFVHDELKVGQ